MARSREPRAQRGARLLFDIRLRGGGRSDRSRLLDIVDGTDAPRELLASKEVSALVFAFRRDDLYKALPLVGRENRQKEYYLNAVFPILIEKGERVSAVKVDTGGMMGPNSRADLARLGALLRRRGAN
jgi:bifunctional N-acetylglucosamine-1-phosphate-uridyltransferase/glucosamine-1-phosphate-acetyltransferase GlmU-like protein